MKTNLLKSIFISLLLLVGATNAWAYDVKSPHVYFNATNVSSWPGVNIVVGHDSYSFGDLMSKVSNTNLYYAQVTFDGSDANGFVFIGDNSQWGEWKQQSLYNRTQSQSNRTDYLWFHNTITNGLPFGTYYFSTSGNKKAIDYSQYTTIPTFNTTSAVRVRTGTSGTYSNASGTYPANISIQGTYISENGKTNRTSITSTNASDGDDKKIYGSVITGLVTLSYSNLNEAYTFDGWGTSNSKVSSTSTDYVFNQSAHTTVYAFFTKKTYTITYKQGANGSGSIDAGTKEHGVNYTLSSNKFTRTGYTQTGWSTSDGGAKVYDLGGTYTTNTNVTLYPFWTPNQYTITYKHQGGSNFSDTDADGLPTTHTYGAETTLKDPTRLGFIFGGWFTSSDCTGTAVTSLGATAYTADITLYAKWTPVPTLEISTNQQYLRTGKDKLQLNIEYANIPDGHCYRVKVGDGYYNGNEVGANEDRVAISSSDGSVTFKSNQPLGLGEKTIIVELWKDGPTGTSSNPVTVTVEQDHQVAVYAYLDGVRSEAGGRVTSATPIFPTANIKETITASQPNPGYSFVNWTASNGNIKFTDPNSLSTTVTATGGGDIYANYTETKHNVTIKANNNTYGTVSSGSINVGQHTASSPITATSNAGCRFVNWTATPGITIANETIPSTTITATQGGTLTANFEEIKYDVQVSVAAGQESWGSVSTTSTSVGSVSAQQITATANTNLGYVFDHWELSGGITITSGNANNATIKITATKAGSLTAHFRGVNRLQNVFLIGTMNGWKGSDADWQFYKLPGESGNTVTLTKTINKSDFHSVGYEFGINIFHSDWQTTYWKNAADKDTKMDAHNCTGWGFNAYSGEYRTYIDLNVSGEYTFTLTDAHENHNQKLSITYPDKSFIEGDFATAWDENAYPLTENGDIQTVTIPITSKKDVEFRLVSHGKLFGSDTQILVGSNSQTLSPKNMEDQGAVMTIGAYVEGDYTFSYNKSTKVLTVTWPVINQLQVYRANPEHAEAINNWNWDHQDGSVYTKALSLNANTTYEFKTVVNSDFFGKNTTLTRQSSSTTLSTSGGDVKITTDVAGNYIFTYNSESKQLSVTYPEAYTFTYGIGTNSNGLGTVAVIPDIESETLVAAGTDLKLSATPNLGYKFVGWYRDNDCTDQVSTANPYNFPINRTTTLYAKFEKRDLYIHTDIIGWGTEPALMRQGDTNKAVYIYTTTLEPKRGSQTSPYNDGYHFHFVNTPTNPNGNIAYNWDSIQTPTGTNIDGPHLTDPDNPTIQFGLARKSDVTITLTLQSANDDPKPTVEINANPYYTIIHSNPTNGNYTIKVGTNEAVSTNTESLADKTITLSAIPNSGYHFDSWTVTKTGGETVSVTDNTFTMPAEDITIAATFAATTYNITYNLDGGTNHADNPSNYTVETETINLQNATKDGFNFCGWFSDETFTTQVTEIAKGSTGDITLYARWGNTFDHPHIYLNNANLQWDEAMILIGNEKNSAGYNHVNQVPNTQLVYFHPEVEWLDQTRFSILKAKDWEFNNEAFDTRINYLNDRIGVQQNYNFFSDTTYYVTGSVPSTINLQKAKYDNAVDYPSLPFFNAIQSVKVRDAKNVAYTVADGEWPATLSLTGTNMGANGGWDSTERNTITSSSSNDPEEAHRKYVAVVTGLITQTFSNLKEDYIFEGWGMGDSPSSTADSYKYHITENTTVYAFFTKIYRTVITLDQEGAAQNGTTSVTATYGENMPEATMPTAADGYDFKGYYDAKDGAGTPYYNASGASARAWDKKDTECTLYPYWSPIEYTITYHLNDGSGTMTPTTYTIESETFKLPTPTKTGYTFAGWYENVELTGNAVDQIEKGSTTGNKEYWAKWNVASYTITFDAKGGSGGPSTLTVPFGNQLPDITIPTNAGHLFLGYYNGTGTQYYDANGKGLKKMPANNITLYAKWLNSSDCIFFYNNLGWEDVYVYFYSSDKYWDDYMGTGSENEKNFEIKDSEGNVTDSNHKPHYRGYTGKMTKIEGTNIWYYNRSIHSEITRDNYSCVAFTKDQQDEYEWFWKTEVVRRSDFNSNVPMFVSMKADKVTKNESSYYNYGYWMNYPTNTGYKLHIFDKDGNKINDQLVDIPFEYSDNTIMPWSVNVSLEGAKTYAFKIQRADDTWYGNNGTMTTNSSGDVGQTAWEFTTGTNNCKITTTAPGTYVFTLKYDKDRNSNYNYLVGVEYPASKGDYRLVYQDNAHPFHPGHLLKKRDGKDTVSFFVHYNESPVIMLQQVTKIDANTGAITWTTKKTYALTANQAGSEHPGQSMMPGRRNAGADEVILHIGGEHLENVDATGVYNFILEQTSGEATLQGSATKYDGNFYIRTNAAAGGWGDFRQAGNKMTYSSYAESHSDFNHYFVEWVETETGGNVKFTIANDYSYCISDTLDADNIIQKNGVSPGCLPADANVRFGWDSRNNKLTRAYIAGSGNVWDRFLVVTGNNLLKDAEGKTLDAGSQGDTDKDKEDPRCKLNANEDIFKDLGNWVYQVDVTAQNGTMINLTALYNGTIQYFKGAEGEPSYPLLASTNVGKEYKIRMIYNFKTNHLVVAWLPDSPYNANGDEYLGTDMLLIRRNQEPATQLKLNSIEEKDTISGINTAYAVMTFTQDFVGANEPIHQRKHYWVSFPFDVKISDVFGFSEYKDHWIMQAYDGAGRAANGLWADTDTYWKYITNANYVMRKGQGYVLTLDVKKMLELDPVFANTGEVSLYFPSRGELDTITSYLPTAATVPAHTCTIERENRKIYDSHWNMIGVPGFADIANFNTDAPDKYLQESELEYQGDSLSFYYEYIPAENSYEVRTGTTTFQSMYSYMVQFAGTINWSSKEVTYNGQQQLAARRNSEGEYPEKVSFRLELAQGDKMADQTFVQLQQEGATPEFDMNLDLTKIINSGANIYTLAGESRIQSAGNALPMGEAVVVPVGVKIDAEGEYTFRMPDGTEGMVVELVDYETNTRTNLLLTDYTVTLPKGTNEYRFALHIQPQKDVVTSLENIGEGVNNGEAVNKYLIDGKLIIRTAEGIFDAQGHRL